ncbi:MAG: hypothetical protein GY817_00615 [bacterium]|nr:hypothetical protein [bacterium]
MITILEQRQNLRRQQQYTRETDIYQNNQRNQKRRKNDVLEKEILSKIAVNLPYFALNNLEETVDGFFKANIPIEQPLGCEISPITAGETSRHLAILGSCAIANNEKKKSAKNYHLATKAIYKRHLTNVKFEKLFGIAKIEEVNKRTKKAYTQLINEKQEIITTLDVEYTLLSKKLFEKQFQDYKIDLRNNNKNLDIQKNRQNFYTKLLNLPSIENSDDLSFSVDLGVINSDMCMGHFPKYPAFPVAFSANIITSLSAVFLKENIIKKNNIKILGKSSVIHAYQLLFAGTDIQIKCRLKNQKGNIFTFEAHFLNKENTIINFHYELIAIST